MSKKTSTLSLIVLISLLFLISVWKYGSFTLFERDYLPDYLLKLALVSESTVTDIYVGSYNFQKETIALERKVDDKSKVLLLLAELKSMDTKNADKVPMDLRLITLQHNEGSNSENVSLYIDPDTYNLYLPKIDYSLKVKLSGYLPSIKNEIETTQEVKVLIKEILSFS